LWISEQQEQHARRDYCPTLKAAACGQVAVHDDIGRKNCDQRHQNLRAGLHDLAGLPRLCFG